MSTPSRDELASVNEAAADFYRTQLLTSSGPQHYLTSRGFGHLLHDTTWTIGCAPAGWTTLRDHLYRHGYDEHLLIAAGLCLRSRHRTTIDRFRERLTFGIRDQHGLLVGFTARRAPSAPTSTPKYLNTPTTPLFDKSTVLFGLGENHTKITEGVVDVMLVEGPLDALAIDHAAPRHVALALCGTALTTAHANLVAHQPVNVAFDADTAGITAAVRAYQALAGATWSPRAVALPTGSDPANLLRVHGPHALAHTLNQTRPLADRVIDAALHGRNDLAHNAETQVSAARASAHAITNLRADDVARQVIRVAQATQLPISAITRELTTAATTPPTNRPRPALTIALS